MAACEMQPCRAVPCRAVPVPTANAASQPASQRFSSFVEKQRGLAAGVFLFINTIRIASTILHSIGAS
jgi:hypothetical protein